VTGIDDPYEAPLGSEIILDTVGYSVEENVELIFAYLTGEGFIPSIISLQEAAEG
jgi:adenylylsulfate kinase-like enzyme